MFGYVKVLRADLRIREYEYYRASYCGLCRAMGKCTGQCSRMLLSYDFAFLANVRMALSESKAEFRRRRCLVHPFRRRPMMEPNGQLRYCAAASAILAWEKCRDNVADERGLGRFKARLQCLFLHGMYRRAKKQVPELAASVRAHLQALSQKELEEAPLVDAMAAIFGELLAEVCAYGLEGDRALLARKIGFETGCFIYILDALDDFAEDVRKKRFNPFIPQWGSTAHAEAKQGVRAALIAYLYRLEAALDLLPESDPVRKEILRNILYLGMPASLDRVLSEKRCRKEEHDE